MASGWRKPERTLDVVVDEKMRVLEDFYIVDKSSYGEIRSQLICAIQEHSNFNPDSVADRFAKDLISKKLV